jgi:hypothetical protein
VWIPAVKEDQDPKGLRVVESHPSTSSGQAFSQRTLEMGHAFFVSVNFNIKTNFKINGKGNGRECPFHTGVASLRLAGRLKPPVYFLWA